MKKGLALLLVLAALIPFAVTAKADAASRPFYMFNREDVQEGKYDNIFSAPFFWTAEQADDTISWDGATSPKDLAKKTYDLFQTRPEGARYIKVGFPVSVYLYENMENYVYIDKGVHKLAPWFQEFLIEFKALGGVLDGVILDTDTVDTQIVDMSAYYLHQKATTDPLVYHTIVSDPRYTTEIRPLLEEQGFPFWENVTESTPEIYSISRNMTGAKYTEAQAIWDQVMRNRLGGYLDEAVCLPLWESFPDALVSDCQSADRAGWFKFPTDTGDNTAFNTPYSYNDAIYQQTAFNMTLWEINQFKNIYASTDNKTLSAWLNSYNYGDKPLDYSAYTTEIVYHLGLLNPQPFLGYVLASEVPDMEYYVRLDALSQQLHELTRVAGFSDRTPIEVPVNWNDSYLLSGMYANGRNIWRITPDTTQVTLEGFKVEGSDPTFSVGGKTITFPGGTIIADTAIDNVGSCGYWVETAADVIPIVTTDAKRFENYPSLFLGFNDCQPGVFDYNTGNPIGAWEFTWNKQIGSTTKIITVNGNRVLTIDGDVTLKSVKIPENITAGDSYAKDQSWDVTITIPENMPADAVVQILCYAGKGQDAEDGGFKVANGKLYYSHNGEYREMSNIAAGTYIFRRVMNFHNPESFRCSYYVFSDKGTVVAMAADIPTPAFTAITSIGFTTEKVANAIHLDNFRISVTGKAADFEIYDAKTGIQVKDTDTARAANTAYRLSWLNATGKTETCKVVVEIYEGDALKETKLIQEVKMKPGCDGVETGVVEVTEGQSVKVKLETSYRAVIPETDTAKPGEVVATEPTAAPTEPTSAPTVFTSAPTVFTSAPTESTVTAPTQTVPTSATKATEPVSTEISRPATEVTQAPETQATQAPTSATKPVETKAPTQATEITEVTEATEATQTTEETQTTNATEATAATSASETTEATTPGKPDDEGKKNNGPNTVLIVVMIAVVLAAGAACWYSFIFKKKKNA